MSFSRHQAVGAYRRWSPPAFDADDETIGDGRAHAVHDPSLAGDEGGAPSAPVEDSDLSASLRLPTADEIEAMFEQAREEGRAVGHEEGRAAGHEEGHAAGLAQGKAEARAEAEQLSRLVAAMDDALDRLGGEVASELVTLAIALARQMVGDALAVRPEAVAATVREALQHMPQHKVRVRLNPEDVALVREHLADQLEHGHHHLVEDAEIARGGCVLEAAGCEVDATLHTRWRRIVEGLGRSDSGWDADDA